MITFNGIVKNALQNPNGTLTLETMSSLYNELLQSVDSFTVDAFNPDLDTWEKVIKMLLDTYTLLRSSHISIKDNSGNPIPSEYLTWSNTTVNEILYDIAIRTNCYYVLDEYDNLVFRPYSKSYLSDVILERGYNLSVSNIRNDTTRKINSVSAYVNWNTTGMLLVKRDQNLLYQNYSQTQHSFKATSFRIPVGIAEINKYAIYAEYTTLPPSVDLECKLLYHPSYQAHNAPPYNDPGSILPNSTTNFDRNDFTSAPQWISASLSPPVDVSALGGKKIWFATKRVGTLNYDFSIYIASQGEWINLSSDENFDYSVLYGGKSLGLKIFGDAGVVFSGSYSDQESIGKSGLSHKDLVSKTSRSDSACQKHAESVVSIYKDGIYLGNGTLPFSEIYAGNRIIVHDPYYNINYERLFISSTHMRNGITDINVTESELEIAELATGVNREISNSDNLLLG